MLSLCCRCRPTLRAAAGRGSKVVAAVGAVAGEHERSATEVADQAKQGQERQDQRGEPIGHAERIRIIVNAVFHIRVVLMHEEKPETML
jgi:hypothetical protein